MHPDIGLLADDHQDSEPDAVWLVLLKYAAKVANPLGLEKGAEGRCRQVAALASLYLSKVERAAVPSPVVAFLDYAAESGEHGVNVSIHRCERIAAAAKELADAEPDVAIEVDPATRARELVQLMDPHANRGGAAAILERLDAIEEPYKSATLAYVLHYMPASVDASALCLALEQRTY